MQAWLKHVAGMCLTAAVAAELRAHEGLTHEMPTADETDITWPEMGFTGQVDFATQYNSFGADIYDDRAAIQPSATFELPEAFVSFNLWTSFAAANREDEEFRDGDEIDFTVAFRPKWWHFEFGVGHACYIFPQVDAHPDYSAEVFTDLGFSIPLEIETLSGGLYAWVAYDYDQGQDFRARLCSDWEYTVVTEPVTLTIPFGAAMGYDHGQFGADAGITDFDFHAGVQLAWEFLFVSLVGHVTLCPDEAINPDDTELWLIATVGVTF